MAKKPPTPTPTNGGPPATTLDPDLILFPKITHGKKRAMLAAFLMCGQLVKAATMAHIDLRYHWKWREDDPDYEEAWQLASRYSADLIENRVIELGMEGYEEGVWHQGVQVGTQRKYLPTLLLAAVNAALPDKYKYRTNVEHTLSPAMQALAAQWQQLRDEASQRSQPQLPAIEEPDAIEGDIEPMPRQPPWTVRPPGPSSRPRGQSTRAQLYSMLDRMNQPRADWRTDHNEEEE